MYRRETMNGTVHQERHQHTHFAEGKDDDDDVDVDGGGGGGESIDDPSHHIRYDHNYHHALHNGGAGATMEEAAALNVVEGVAHNALYVPGIGSSNQLTLSFRGQVFVYPDVSPEKVQAVMLLLDGYEVPTGTAAVDVASQSHWASSEGPVRLNQPQRAASLSRFREKRKERCFDKKIRYTVRKEVALRMQRKKGQFTSSKSISDEAGSSSAEGNVGSSQEEPETSCRHCGISSKFTPMMRRGPAGPRSLCNACGLTWANKGILRDLSKVSTAGAPDHTVKSSEQSNDEANGSDAMAAAGIITSDDENTVLPR
ncbi:GATA transcription factor 24 [Nicotiana tabacum]|uniref:GATA transcription factor 24 n=1 Tax=Nicotiana tabacum TaxID=4097 RepID=A0A1S3X3B1_TOBAC|nr:PREDICTED: GATA transcription factor 24-like [Nicotiana tabacum]